MDLIQKLRQYNRWRRGDDDHNQEWSPDPKEIGELIDAAADRLEVLERERLHRRKSRAKEDRDD